MAWRSPFILWFGIGELAKVNLIAFAVGFVTLITTASGASSIDIDKLNGARSLGANRIDLFFKIIFQSHCNIVKLMSSLWISESIQEKVLKVLSTNLASLMVV